MVRRPSSVKYTAYYCNGLNRADVARFVDFNDGTLIAEYVEGRKKWPRLEEAIGRCKQDGATLVIAKLGRLVRNPKFLALLQEARIDFACLDNQNCNRFTVHILLATAEQESERISQRTRAALRAAVKRTGVKLGSARPGHWDGREHLRGTKQAIAASSKMRRIRTRQTYEFLLPTLKKMRLSGKTMVEIAEWLNDHGHTTTVGHPFNEVSVWRLLKRYLGDDFLGPVKDRGGRPQTIRAMETVTK
jgi:DNA invertase Pin-like site-specific DNA recombinase